MRVLALSALLVGLVAVMAAAQALPVFDATRLYATEAEFTRAIQPYQQAIQADARNARAHYWLGVAYFEAYRQSKAGLAPYATGYVPRAIASLTEAIKLDPNLLGAYGILIDAHMAAGDYDKAEAFKNQLRERTRRAWYTPGPPIGP
ncbi:MAG: tetratricopeptide repeat protein [bacterium]